MFTNIAREREREGFVVFQRLLSMIVAPLAGKMKQILCSDWLPKRPRWAYLARFLTAIAKFFGVIFWLYNKSFIDQACSVKMAGYWPRSFSFCIFMYLDIETQRKNLLNIQSS